MMRYKMQRVGKELRVPSHIIIKQYGLTFDTVPDRSISATVQRIQPINARCPNDRPLIRSFRYNFNPFGLQCADKGHARLPRMQMRAEGVVYQPA